jgi:hypothetical protein
MAAGSTRSPELSRSRLNSAAGIRTLGAMKGNNCCVRSRFLLREPGAGRAAESQTEVPAAQKPPGIYRPVAATSRTEDRSSSNGAENATAATQSWGLAHCLLRRQLRPTHHPETQSGKKRTASIGFCLTRSATYWRSEAALKSRFSASAYQALTGTMQNASNKGLSVESA